MRLKCQNLCCNNDFDQNDQNHPDHENQDKYGKANTLSPFSIFYTGKLTSPKRREFFLKGCSHETSRLLHLLNSPTLTVEYIYGKDWICI